MEVELGKTSKPTPTISPSNPHLVQFDDVAVLSVQSPGGSTARSGTIYRVPHLGGFKHETMDPMYKLTLEIEPPIEIWGPMMLLILQIGGLPDIILGLPMETLIHWVRPMSTWKYLQLFGGRRPSKLNDAISQGQDCLFSPEEMTAMASAGSWTIDITRHLGIVTPWIAEATQLHQAWNYYMHHIGRGVN